MRVVSVSEGGHLAELEIEGTAGELRQLALDLLDAVDAGSLRFVVPDTDTVVSVVVN